MSIPDFSEFLSWLTPEVMAAFIDEGNPIRLRCLEIDLTDKDAIDQISQWVMDQAIDVASKVSFAQLRAYHQWLQENLSQ